MNTVFVGVVWKGPGNGEDWFVGEGGNAIG